ncbi:MAG: phosphate acyltransferase, partial [Bacteroidales bacterium]|nr:phosphate acyltransferase [Bacteroidales bacterium]
MIVGLKKEAIRINQKRTVRILFLEENDKRVRKAIEIIKKEDIAVPFIVNGKNIQEKLNKAKSLLHSGVANALITGATHSTRETIYLAFDFVRKDVKRISGSFLMVSKNENKSFLFTDCAVQPNPDSEQLAEIAKLSAETYHFLIKKEPKLAMLSYSTKGSGKGASAENVQQACKLIKKKYPRLMFDGEMQLDAAIEK